MKDAAGKEALHLAIVEGSKLRRQQAGHRIEPLCREHSMKILVQTNANLYTDPPWKGLADKSQHISTAYADRICNTQFIFDIFVPVLFITGG